MYHYTYVFPTACLQNPIDDAAVNISVSSVSCQRDMGVSMVCPLTPPIYDPDTGQCTNVLVEVFDFQIMHDCTYANAHTM